MNTVTKQIIELFLVILVGFYGGKRNIIDEKLSNGLTRLLLEITTPLLIISSFSFSYNSDMAMNISKAFIYSVIVFITTPLLIKPLLTKIKKDKRDILQFAMVFSNCGFMGYPIAQSVFGDEGVIYTAIFNMVNSIFVWTYGVMLFSDNKSSRRDIIKLLKNPGIISAFIGILIMIFSINIPDLIIDTMKSVGNLTTPLSMIIIGSLLARTELSKLLKDKSLYYGSVIKLIFIPAAVFLVSILFNENSVVLKTFILLEAMPAAAMTTIFAENFNKEKEYSAFIVSFTSVFSVITIPLIIKFCSF